MSLQELAAIGDDMPPLGTALPVFVAADVTRRDCGQLPLPGAPLSSCCVSCSSLPWRFLAQGSSVAIGLMRLRTLYNGKLLTSMAHLVAFNDTILPSSHGSLLTPFSVVFVQAPG